MLLEITTLQNRSVTAYKIKEPSEMAVLLFLHFYILSSQFFNTVAEKAGISLDYLGKIEVSINKPGIKTILKLANALDIPIKEFFEF